MKTVFKMKYQTRQSQDIETLLELLGNRHFTAEDASILAKERGLHLSLTSLYRHLQRLLDEGRVRRFVSEGAKSACYQRTDCHEEHYHLVCEKCGKLIHLECEEIEELKEHVASHHHFHLDASRTVFYGICEDCYAL